MKLRSQMLLVSALTLVVPFVGWQSVKQLYVALQQTRIDEQTLKVANLRLALSESEELSQWLQRPLGRPDADEWYAETSNYPLLVDGYDDDWRNLQGPWEDFSHHNASDENSHLTQQLSSDAFSQLAISKASNEVRFRKAIHSSSLHLFIQIADDNVVFHRLPFLAPDAGENELPDRWQQLVNGDSVEVVIQRDQTGFEHGLLRAIAPGEINVVAASDHAGYQAGDALDHWQAFWAETANGYQVELSLPLIDNGAAVAISVVDVDTVNEPRTRWVGNMGPADMALFANNANTALKAAPVIRASDGLSQRLASWVNEGVRLRLFDSRGWLVADVNQLYTSVEDDAAEEAIGSFDGVLDAILFRLFAFMVADDLALPETRSTTPLVLKLSDARRAEVADNSAVTSRYVTSENDRVLGTLAPIGQNPQRAFLLFEANEEHSAAYTGSQLARLFSLLLLVSLVAGCGLLVFAIVLSSRIRRLSYEAAAAVSMDGRVRDLKVSDTQDEIGDLSRRLSSLLARSSQYTQYLEALSSRLSHELRTPLSVVRTSLENIDRQNLDPQSVMLIERAEGGADNLGQIIKALVESTRLEQSVASAETQRLNLADWLTKSGPIYEQVYPQCQFDVRVNSNAEVWVNVSPELLQQGLDKLINNAVSFSTEPTIILNLSTRSSGASSQAVLSVANKGIAIPEEDTASLFDPLISKRDADDNEELHLGLGLYMVRLISEAAGGSVFARNKNGWVIFGLSLPRT